MKIRKKIIPLILLLILVIAGVAIFFILRKSSDESEMHQPPAMTGMGEDVISATGITSVGMLRL